MSNFRRWPLLLAGLAILAGTIALIRDDTRIGEMLASGVVIGSVLVGAGIVLVVWRQDHPDSDDREGPPDDV